MISNIIPTYNRRDLLLSHLEALRYQTIGCDNFEVIVVDDGSSDGTSDAVKSLRMPYPLRRHRMDDRGFRVAAARNMGASLARGDILVFNDDDVTPEPNCFAVYQETVTPYVAVAGVERHRIAESAIKPNKPWMSFITTNEAVHRNDFNRIGGFDEGSPSYGWEDIDFAIRLAINAVFLTQRMDAVAHHENALYNVNPMTMEQKRLEEQKAWAYFERKYRSRGLDWAKFIL